jgi:hypothetical protein
MTKPEKPLRRCLSMRTEIIRTAMQQRVNHRCYIASTNVAPISTNAAHFRQSNQVTVAPAERDTTEQPPSGREQSHYKIDAMVGLHLGSKQNTYSDWPPLVSRLRHITIQEVSPLLIMTISLRFMPANWCQVATRFRIAVVAPMPSRPNEEHRQYSL